MKIEFVVWQFVRVMVELESFARPRGRDARDTFRTRNTATWHNLDKELEALAQVDATKYAKRMMKDTIVINTKTSRQVVEVFEALGRVISHMGAELRRGIHDDPTQRSSLIFEQTELKKFRATLIDGQAKGRRKSQAKVRPKPMRKLLKSSPKNPVQKPPAKPKGKHSVKLKGRPLSRTKKNSA